MRTQHNNSISKSIKTAIIVGASVIVTICIGGVFLLLNPLVAKSAIPVETSTVHPSPTVALTQVLPSPTSNPTAIPPTIIIPTETQPIPIIEGALTPCLTLQNRELRIVQAGTFVIGEMIIEQIEYINDPGEITIAHLERNTTILSLGESMCYRGERSLFDEVVQSEFQYGCGAGCTSARFVVVPKEGSQIVESYNK